MALMIYGCQECDGEFTMDDKLAGEVDQMVCPRCGRDGSVSPLVDDEDDDDDDDDDD